MRTTLALDDELLAKSPAQGPTRSLDISEATWNRWRNRYGGMKETSDPFSAAGGP